MVIHVNELQLREITHGRYQRDVSTNRKSPATWTPLPGDEGFFKYDYIEFLPGCFFALLELNADQDILLNHAPPKGMSIAFLAKHAEDRPDNSDATDRRYIMRRIEHGTSASSNLGPMFADGTKAHRMTRIVLSEQVFTQWLQVAGIKPEAKDVAQIHTTRAGITKDLAHFNNIQSILNRTLTAPFAEQEKQRFLNRQASQAIGLFFRDLFLCLDANALGRRIGSAEAYRLQKAHKILLNEITDAPTIPRLAERVGLGETRLKTGFKALYGNTIYGFVQHQRLEQARLKLAKGDQNVLSVAMDVGYSCPSRFAVNFKRLFGVSPSRYRRHSSALLN